MTDPLFFQPRFHLDPEDVKVQLRRGSAPLEDIDKDLESGLAKTHRASSASARQKAVGGGGGGGGGIAAVLNSLGAKLGELLYVYVIEVIAWQGFARLLLFFGSPVCQVWSRPKNAL